MVEKNEHNIYKYNTSTFDSKIRRAADLSDKQKYSSHSLMISNSSKYKGDENGYTEYFIPLIREDLIRNLYKKYDQNPTLTQEEFGDRLISILSEKRDGSDRSAEALTAKLVFDGYDALPSDMKKIIDREVNYNVFLTVDNYNEMYLLNNYYRAELEKHPLLQNNINRYDIEEIRIRNDCYNLLSRFLRDKQFADQLTKTFNASGIQITSSARISEHDLPIPSKAPKLWVDREPDINPIQFIRMVYAPWIEAGVMTRGVIRDCDKALYNAYAQWIHRKPEDALTFAPRNSKPGPRPEPDAGKAIERVRANAREAGARFRAKKNLKADGPS